MAPRLIARPRAAFAAASVAIALIVCAAVTGWGAARADAATPASASDVLVSSDGSHFSTTLGSDLFDGLGLLVPGESVSQSVWIKNPTASRASLRVSVADLELPYPAFATGVRISTRDSVDGATTTSSLAELRSCGVIVRSTSLKAHATVKVVMTFTMDESLRGHIAQAEDARLGLVVAMKDSRAGIFPRTGCDATAPTKPVAGGPGGGGGGGTLAWTGGDFPSLLLFAAAILIGGGVFLILARRRRDEQDAEDAGPHAGRP